MVKLFATFVQKKKLSWLFLSSFQKLFCFFVKNFFDHLSKIFSSFGQFLIKSCLKIKNVQSSVFFATHVCCLMARLWNEFWNLQNPDPDCPTFYVGFVETGFKSYSLAMCTRMITQVVIRVQGRSFGQTCRLSRHHQETFAFVPLSSECGQFKKKCHFKPKLYFNFVLMEKSF